jgi:hypothetical protein
VLIRLGSGGPGVALVLGGHVHDAEDGFAEDRLETLRGHGLELKDIVAMLLDEFLAVA